MSERILSILNPDNGRYAITINSEELLLFVAKIREIVREEVKNTYRKKLEDEFFTREEIIAKFKISGSVLAKWNKGEFLVPVKVGGKTLYRKSDVDKILFPIEKKRKKTH